MYCSLEPLIYVIRIYPDSKAAKDRGMYTWSATGIRISRRTIKILGALRAPTIPEWRAIDRFLGLMGYLRAVYYRADGRKRVILYSEYRKRLKYRKKIAEIKNKQAVVRFRLEELKDSSYTFKWGEKWQKFLKKITLWLL